MKSTPEPAADELHELTGHGTPGAVTRRSVRGEETRARILEEAARAFDRGGYLGVNLNDVMQSLGLTKGALYYFFPTKEHLAVEIVQRHFAVWGPMAEAVLAEHDNLLDALIDMSYRVARSYQADPFARAGTRLSTERNLISADLPEPFVAWIERVRQLLEAAQARGEVREGVDVSATADMLVSFFYGAQVVSQYFSDRQDLPARLEAFWAVVEPTLRPGRTRR